MSDCSGPDCTHPSHAAAREKNAQVIVDRGHPIAHSGDVLVSAPLEVESRSQRFRLSAGLAIAAGLAVPGPAFRMPEEYRYRGGYRFTSAGRPSTFTQVERRAADKKNKRAAKARRANRRK